MIKRASKDGSGFQVETEMFGTTHILNVTTDADKICVAGMLYGSMSDWFKVTDDIATIKARYDLQKEGK